MKITNQRKQMELTAYILESIQVYKHADSAHGIDHILNVMKNAKNIAISLKDETLDTDIITVAAAFHDIGLVIHGREDHEFYSAEYVLHDPKLKEFFNEDQIKIIADACREHRASYKGEYSSIYSKIISDADRCDDIPTMITRAYNYTIYHNPEMNDLQIYKEVYKHLKEKYGYGGYARLNLESNVLEPARKLLDDEKEFRREYLICVGDL